MILKGRGYVTCGRYRLLMQKIGKKPMSWGGSPGRGGAVPGGGKDNGTGSRVGEGG